MRRSIPRRLRHIPLITRRWHVARRRPGTPGRPPVRRPALRLAAAALPVALLPALAAPAAAGAIGRTQAAAMARARASVSPPGDEAVTGSGDPAGYHLYVSSANDGWRWRPLATIQPGGSEDQRWIGQQCLTGDGREVVAVVAPWSASNSAAGMDAGGLAYAVTMPGGRVTPLATGVSLAYFNPGCGLGGAIALTSYGGPQQRPTRISVLNAATGAVTATSTVPGEITSAVPAGTRILAARGGQLVDVTGDRAAVLASFGGQVSRLHPAASGGVDLVAQAGGGQAGIWSAGGGASPRQLGAGPAASVRLFGGLGGRNLAAGLTALTPDAGVSALPAAPHLTGASLQGGLELTERAGVQRTAAAADGRAIAEMVAGAGRVADTELPAPAARRAEALPRQSVAVAAPATTSAVTTSATITSAAGRAGAAAAAGSVTGTPQCAVPRNDIYKQVWQPTSAQVRWAVNQAVQGYLTPAYPDAERPRDAAMYAITDGSGSALPQASASQDFPLVANTPNVPPLVMYGILAQESNWSQASWHAVPGRAGNPLVANYYGDDANASTIDYSQADCGYGIAQVTTGMMQADWTGTDTGQIAPPTAQQVRVAVDYATNIAAGVQLLQEKWRDLHTLGMTMNNDDPTKIENWYAAIWAYNTGVYMNPQLGGEGLGWLNNPANPIYPSPRPAFLHDGTAETYGDASTPNLWPYQERVFGWMEVPQLDGHGNPEYNGTFDWTNLTGVFLDAAPDSTFCSTTFNSCDPSVIGTTTANGSPVDPCPLENQSCWWDQPVTWANCSAQCITDTPSSTPSGQTDYPAAGAPEPPAAPLSATCSPGAGTPVTTSSGSLIPGTVLVDEEMLPDENPAGNTPNLMGCSGSNAALSPPASAQASFQLLDGSGQPIDGENTPSATAAIDLHQLGAGPGGHMFFTHTIPASQSSQQVRGVWTTTLPASTDSGTVYQVYAFVPDIAAGAGYAPYRIDTGGVFGGAGYGPPGSRHADLYRVINQANYANTWVSLGYYLCGGPDQDATMPGPGPANCTMRVTLSNVTPDGDPTQGSDIAYDAVAFVPAPIGRNVIIGDSYSSGEGLQGGFDDGTNVPPSMSGASKNNGDLCHRAPGAWGRLWDPSAIQLACSGSNMWDVAGVLYYQNLGNGAIPANDGSVYYAPPSGSTISDPPTPVAGWTTNGPASSTDPSWNFDNAGSDYYAEPTFQTDLLRALKPKRVILTVGGNDAMFADVLTNCAGTGVPCQGKYAIAGSSKDKLDNRITSLAAPLQAAFGAIVSAAGGASKVVVLTYPNIFAPDPTVVGVDCTFIEASDQTWLIGKAKELDNTITSAAAAAGIPSGNVVDEYGAFAGHELCKSPDDVTEPSDLAYALGNPAVIDNFFHPDSAGYQALVQKLAAQIGSP